MARRHDQVRRGCARKVSAGQVAGRGVLYGKQGIVRKGGGDALSTLFSRYRSPARTGSPTCTEPPPVPGRRGGAGRRRVPRYPGRRGGPALAAQHAGDPRPIPGGIQPLAPANPEVFHIFPPGRAGRTRSPISTASSASPTSRASARSNAGLSLTSTTGSSPGSTSRWTGGTSTRRSASFDSTYSRGRSASPPRFTISTPASPPAGCSGPPASRTGRSRSRRAAGGRRGCLRTSSSPTSTTWSIRCNTASRSAPAWWTSA